MFLKYHPEGQEAPTVYKYEPKKLMSAEREALEKRTGLTYEQFHTKLLEGSSVCRRALLFMFRKREYPGVRYEDVDFAWGECELGLYKDEVEDMIKAVEDSNVVGNEREAALSQLAAMLEDAPEDGDAGKAPSRS